MLASRSRHGDADVVDPGQKRCGHAPYRVSHAWFGDRRRGARTPIGKLLGSLADFPAVDLGGVAIEAALGRAGIAGDAVDYVIMGQVLQAGAGQITARQAAVKGGIPMTVPALTINKVCLSGLDAIALADQLIGAGEFDVVVAGGMESMTNAPHLLPGARAATSTATARWSTRWPTTGCSARSTSARWVSRPSATTPCSASPARSRTSSRRARTSWPRPPQKNGAFDDEIVAGDRSRSARRAGAW